MIPLSWTALRSLSLFVLLNPPFSRCDVLPEPLGKFSVASNALKLLDETRQDRWTGNDSRAIMVSVYYPVPKNKFNPPCPGPYAPPKTSQALQATFVAYGAPEDYARQLLVPLVCTNHSSSRHLEHVYSAPLVIFSPGFRCPRFVYTTMALELSSRGFVVATIDHPSDAIIVEFPDGSTTAAREITEAQQTEMVDVRTEDVSFVISELGRGAVIGDLIPGAEDGLDVGNVVVYGQSMGGATAVRALLRDGSVAAAVNLDGKLFGTDGNEVLQKPLLLWGATGEGSANPNMTGWAGVMSRSSSWIQELSLASSHHMTFSDEPMIATLNGGLSDDPSSDIYVGKIAGKRLNEIFGVYLTAFLDLVLYGNESSYLEGPDVAFPEVLFL